MLCFDIEYFKSLNKSPIITSLRTRILKCEVRKTNVYHSAKHKRGHGLVTDCSAQTYQCLWNTSVGQWRRAGLKPKDQRSSHMGKNVKFCDLSSKLMPNFHPIPYAEYENNFLKDALGKCTYSILFLQITRNIPVCASFLLLL